MKSAVILTVMNELLQAKLKLAIRTIEEDSSLPSTLKVTLKAIEESLTQNSFSIDLLQDQLDSKASTAQLQLALVHKLSVKEFKNHFSKIETIVGKLEGFFERISSEQQQLGQKEKGGRQGGQATHKLDELEATKARICMLEEELSSLGTNQRRMMEQQSRQTEAFLDDIRAIQECSSETTICLKSMFDSLQSPQTQKYLWNWSANLLQKYSVSKGRKNSPLQQDIACSQRGLYQIVFGYLPQESLRSVALYLNGRVFFEADGTIQTDREHSGSQLYRTTMLFAELDRGSLIQIGVKAGSPIVGFLQFALF